MKTRGDWLAKVERRYATHPVHGMRFRSMLGSELARYNRATLEETKQGLVSRIEKIEEQEARLIVMSACDDDGKLIFKADDIRPLMAAMDGATMMSLYRFAAAHCGLTEPEQPLEELGKNSTTTSSDEQPS